MKCSDISYLEILQAIQAQNNKPIGDYRDITDFLDKYPYKVVMAKLEKCSHRGYIDSGVTIRRAWLTKEGREELERLKNA